MIFLFSARAKIRSSTVICQASIAKFMKSFIGDKGLFKNYPQQKYLLNSDNDMSYDILHVQDILKEIL